VEIGAEAYGKRDRRTKAEVAREFVSYRGI